MATIANGDGDDGLDVIELDNGKFAFTWTSPSGACHQGPGHYKRRGDARRAGRDWLVKRGQPG
jgi:hypothetical protein